MSLMETRAVVRKTMIEALGAKTLAWEAPGPAGTGLECIQCWAIDNRRNGLRLVLVEIYRKGGFEVFPQILTAGIETTVSVVKRLPEVEAQFENRKT